MSESQDLTSGQKIFKKYLEENLQDVNQDMERAIIRMRNHWRTAPPESVHAVHGMSATEKNQIICDLTLPF